MTKEIIDISTDQRKPWYICIYKGKQIEIYADTPLKARTEANKIFKAKKDREISTHLCELNWKEILQSTSF